MANDPAGLLFGWQERRDRLPDPCGGFLAAGTAVQANRLADTHDDLSPSRDPCAGGQGLKRAGDLDRDVQHIRDRRQACHDRMDPMQVSAA
jgi:hypothetical protein